MSLYDVKSQNHIIEAFQRSLELGRLGQSFIFSGPDGVGRFKMAGELAKLLLCESPAGNGTADSCGVCASCRLFDFGTHPDFRHIFKELNKFSQNAELRKKSPSEFPIDVVREFFIDVIAGKPQIAKRTVYVLSEAEKLNASAQNAILKTLEEPPSHCVIILLCTKTERLLDTILSRCQVYRFGPVETDFIVSKLAGVGIGANEAKFWAKLTNGSLGESQLLSTLSCNCYSFKKQLVADLTELALPDCIDMAEKLLAKAAEIAEAIGEAGAEAGKSDLKRRAQKLVLMMVMSALLDASRIAVSSECAVNADQLCEIEKLAGLIDPVEATKLLEKVNTNTGWIDRYVNEKLIFEDILINFALAKV
jgi:DNA polymerase-3 subunit delta'